MILLFQMSVVMWTKFFLVFKRLLDKINKPTDSRENVINNYNIVCKFAMILLAIHISLRVRMQIDCSHHFTNIPEQWKNEANDLIKLLEGSQLCFSTIEYRIPEGNLELKRTFRCTNELKNHSAAEVSIPHFCNEQLFAPDTSWVIIKKLYYKMWAYFGIGYYPRWEGEFKQHANMITTNDLTSEFEKNICLVFEKHSELDCLHYVAMLLKSITNGVPMNVSRTVVENSSMKVNIHCSICFKNEGVALCKRCSPIWSEAKISEDWQLKSLYE